MENLSKYVEDFVLNTFTHVFLTGKAGTGKTTLLKKIIEKSDKKLAVVAPTGVAAINAGGVTIHSLFQLPPKTFIPTDDPAPNYGFMNMRELAATQKIRRNQRKVIYELELLIIDEISMVRPDMLDAIDATLRRIRKSDKPFGGVQLFVIGDLFQLSPVMKGQDQQVLRQYYPGFNFFDSIAWRASKSVTIELTKVYRQEDEKFINVLNNIRLGIKEQSDLDLLNSRYIGSWDDKKMLLLTTHNRKANAINTKELNNLTTKSHQLKAEVKGQFYENSFPVDENLSLKEGAQVMFIKNHKDGLYFNGLIGRVYKIDKKEIKVVTLEGDTIAVEPEEWKNTKYEVDNSGNINQKELGSFVQFPLKLAWAVTVHKSQGLTFEELIVDLEDSFAAGQLYVALSRCRSLEGLHLSSMLSARNIIVDQHIIEYYQDHQDHTDIELELETAQKDYEDIKLKNSFDFDKISGYVNDVGDYVGEKDWEIKGNIRRWLRKLNKIIGEYHQVGLKFQAQLDSILRSDAEDSEQLKMIRDRVEKGIIYFTDNIHDAILEVIKAEKEKYKSITKYKTLVTRLGQIEGMLWNKISMFYNIEYRGTKVFTGEVKYKRKAIFGTKKSDKPKTHDLTLELWNNKYSIDEIAKAREIAVSTVESHMGKLLSESRVKIEDLMTNDRLLKLSHYFTEGSDETLTDVIKKIPFETSFGELRWVRIWLGKK